MSCQTKEEEPNIHKWTITADPDGVHIGIFVAWLRLFGFNMVAWLMDILRGDHE